MLQQHYEPILNDSNESEALKAGYRHDDEDRTDSRGNNAMDCILHDHSYIILQQKTQTKTEIYPPEYEKLPTKQTKNDNLLSQYGLSQLAVNDKTGSVICQAIVSDGNNIEPKSQVSLPKSNSSETVCSVKPDNKNSHSVFLPNVCSNSQDLPVKKRFEMKCQLDSQDDKSWFSKCDTNHYSTVNDVTLKTKYTPALSIGGNRMPAKDFGLQNGKSSVLNKEQSETNDHQRLPAYKPLATNQKYITDDIRAALAETDSQIHASKKCVSVFNKTASPLHHDRLHGFQETSWNACKNAAVLKCLKCDALFPNRLALNLHHKVHAPSYRSKWFQSRSKLYPNVHPYVCLCCEALFVTKKGLDHHSAVHGTTGWFSCSTCGKRFMYEELANVHRRLIHGQQKSIEAASSDLRAD